MHRLYIKLVMFVGAIFFCESSPKQENLQKAHKLHSQGAPPGAMNATFTLEKKIVMTNN